MLPVRKKTYHKRKQTIQQFQFQLSQLQAENNRLKTNNTHTAEREREREQDNSKLITLLNERTEQLEHAENFIKILQTELEHQGQEHSDYHFKGEYELQRLRHLLSSSEIQLAEKREKIINLALELDQVENQFRVHQITFNEIVRQRDGTLEKLGKVSYLLEQETLKNQINYETLKSVVLEREKLVKTLIAKQQKLVNYWKSLQKYKNLNQQYQEELKLRTENESLLATRFQKLQNYYQKKKTQNQELTIQLEEKETTINHQNQTINELENEITDFQSQLETKQQTIWENEDYLTNSDEVLAHKNTQITALNQQVDQQTQIINQVIETKKVLVHKFHKNTSKWKKKYKKAISERDTYLTKRNNLQNWKDNHDCSANCSLPHSPVIINNVNCSHTDYEQIKSERDNYKNQLATHICSDNSCSEAYHNELRLEREKELINQIIFELELALPKNSSLGKVIQEIKKLIQKPGQEILVEVGEKIEMIRDIDLNSLEKGLGIELSSEVKERIGRATNYQELSSLRNKEIKSYLAQRKGEIITSQNSKELGQPQPTERIVWISLLVISLLTIGGLLVKIKKNKKQNNK